MWNNRRIDQLEMGANGFQRQLSIPGWGGNPNLYLSIQQRRALSIFGNQGATQPGAGVFNRHPNIAGAGVLNFGHHNTIGARPNQPWAWYRGSGRFADDPARFEATSHALRYADNPWPAKSFRWRDMATGNTGMRCEVCLNVFATEDSCNAHILRGHVQNKHCYKWTGENFRRLGS